jgi:antitoxin (DNA-binding transcriptional repressor) of toxin-antitoxin stability system
MTKSISRRVGTHEAKTRLSELLRAVEGGEEIEILRGPDVIARLVPATERRVRRLGEDAGAFTVPDDFDAPLPDDVIAEFER